MSTLWKLVKSSGRSHEKTKLDPGSGTRYCPCHYHEQKQKAKKKKLTALGVKDSVNYYDPEGYHNRPPRDHTEYADDLNHDHHSDYNYSSQSRDDDHQETGTYSTSSTPEPEPGYISSYISGGEYYGAGNSTSEADESSYVAVDEPDSAAGGIESEYCNSARENGFPVDEPDAGNWRFGDYSFDRNQWEANSTQQFHHFVRGGGRY